MPERPPTFCFGPFEFDSHTGELRKFAHRIRLQGNSVKILEALLCASGELVTREELQQKIWPADTFVDFEHGLNTAVAKLRQALADSASAPRYVETLERRGYRFIAEVQVKERVMAAAAVSDAVGAPVSPGVGQNDLGAPGKSGVGLPGDFRGRDTYKFRRAALSGAVLLVILAAALSYFLWKRSGVGGAPTIRSLAVLPFKDISVESGQDVLADGITDGLVTNLAQIGSLRVISSTSAMSYKGSSKRLPDIARELHVDGIVEGTVQRAGQRVRISVQLIDARTDTHLWASEYDRELKDILGLQGEVAHAIAGNLRLLLTSGQEARLRLKQPAIPAALEAYTRGRSHWYKRWQGGEPDLRTAGSYFQQAVQIDPNYAAAYSGLADYYAFLAIYGLEPPAEVWPKCEQALQRALELDPDLGEAHVSLAATHLYWHWDFKRAEQESSRALQLNPNYSEAHSFRSTLLATIGRFDESIAAAREAEDLDPIGQYGRYLLALSRAHRYQDLEREARAIIPKDPAFGWDYVAVALSGQRKFDEAFSARMRALESNGDTERVNAYKIAYPAGGQAAVAKWELQLLKQRANGKYISPFRIAALQARAGLKDEMYKSLDLAYSEHAPLMVFLHVDNAFDGLRDEPRFADLVRRVGLPASVGIH